MFRKRASWIWRLLFDLVLFIALPSLFLLSYTFQFHAPTTSVWPHYQWVGLIWLGLVLLRLLFNSALPAPVARFISSTALAACLAGFLLYYAIVWIGLSSWGRVTSWDLIVTYTLQLPALCEAIGVEYGAVVVALAALVLLIWLASYIYYKKFDWLPRLVQATTPRIRAEIGFALAVLVFVGFWRVAQFVEVRSAEPIMLTLNPEFGKSRLQSHHVVHNEELGKLEDIARHEYHPNPSAIRRNVFVIVVDALRADHLSLHDYARATTPHLVALARSGQADMPARMYSICAESACGLMGLATSRYSHQLPENPITLQEVLMLHGYKTHMVLGGDHTHFYGLRDAYGRLDSYYDGSMTTSRYMNDDRLIMDRLTEMGEWQGEPLFMQFHLMSSHGLGRRLPDFDRFQPAKSYYADMGTRILLNTYAPDENYVNFYDNGVLQTDHMIASILEALEQRGYLKNALVVVTGDHGELLGEHGYYAHAHTVYEPVLNIPFLMARYGYESKAEIPRELISSQIDIAPTILAELNIPSPKTWVGLSLQKDSERARERRFIYFQQQAEYGLLDLGQPGQVWKYRVNSRDRSEWAHDVSVNRDEIENHLHEIPTELKSRWIQELLELQMSAYEYASGSIAGDQLLH